MYDQRKLILVHTECFWNLPICDTKSEYSHQTDSMYACANWNGNEVHTYYAGYCDIGWQDGRDAHTYGEMSYWCLMVNSGTAPGIPPESPYP